MKSAAVEIWVVVDENGDSAVGPDQSAALAAYDENVGRDDDNPVGLRFVKIAVSVPLPETIELAATVTAEESASVAVA